MIRKKTKIVCTIGPASSSKEMLKKMARAGMNVARLNFSHGGYPDFENIIRNIRAAERELKTRIAIMQDLQGPKIRVGELPEKGVILKKGKTIILTVGKKKAAGSLIPVQYRGLPADVKKGDRILLADGLMELTVLKKNRTDIYCRVVEGGTLYSHKGINVPTGSISANPLTPKDLKDLDFGLKHDVDFVALSFVRKAKDIADLRDIIRRKRARAKIVAKIERHEAIKNLEEIIHETDAVMVARGDMGVEIPAEMVPIVQKKLIHLANAHGKPVITATEMLQSMIQSPRATRAEVSDVANAIFDHTDAVMLSNESAVGKYPVKAVETLTKVAVLAEKEMRHQKVFVENGIFHNGYPVSYAICSSAAELAAHMNADVIVAITASGFTAEHIAKHRTGIPIIAITDDEKVARQLQLVWGVEKVLVRSWSAMKHLENVKKTIIQSGLMPKGTKAVVVMNASQNEKHISTIVL